MSSSPNNINTRPDSSSKIISLAEYRARKLGQADGDAPPPPPGALGARPLIWTARLEADARQHAAQARAFTDGQVARRRLCHATPA